MGTYHMPCMFMIPAVMTIHTSMAIKHLAKLAGPDPLVFGGDFNFTPDSDCYKLATQGELTVACGNSAIEFVAHFGFIFVFQTTVQFARRPRRHDAFRDDNCFPSTWSCPLSSATMKYAVAQRLGTGYAASCSVGCIYHSAETAHPQVRVRVA